MSTKTNIPHTKLVEFSSSNTLHRGVLLISYCKSNDVAIKKAKEEIQHSSKKRIDDYIFVVR